MTAPWFEIGAGHGSAVVHDGRCVVAVFGCLRRSVKSGLREGAHCAFGGEAQVKLGVVGEFEEEGVACAGARRMARYAGGYDERYTRQPHVRPSPVSSGTAAPEFIGPGGGRGG